MTMNCGCANEEMHQAILSLMVENVLWAIARLQEGCNVCVDKTMPLKEEIIKAHHDVERYRRLAVFL